MNINDSKFTKYHREISHQDSSTRAKSHQSKWQREKNLRSVSVDKRGCAYFRVISRKLVSRR